MFDILLGWNKASEYKKLVMRVHCRLKILKKRRYSIVRHLRQDIAQLLKNGQDESAFARVEQLFKDESLLAAYDLLEHFCGYIIVHFPNICRHKDCPNDVNEAVSTLVFAAAWFGDLPELQTFRKLFGEHYGHMFTKPSVDLYPGSLVNQEIRKKLCISSIPHEVKLRVINEIAIEYSLHLGQLGYGNNHKQHVMQLSGKHDCEWEGFGFEEENGETQVNDNTASGVHALVSYANDVPTEASSREILEYLYEPKLFPVNESYHRSVESFCSDPLSAASFDNRVKTGQTETSSEISFQFHRRSIVFLDEIQEFQFGVRDNIGEDKRIFIFNSTIRQLEGNYGVHRASSFVSSRLESCESVTTIPETQHTRAGLGDHFKKVKTSWKWWKRRSDFKNSHSDQSCPSPALSTNHDARELSCGSTYKFSPSKKCLYHRFFQQSKHWRKMPAQEARSSSYKCHEKSLSHQQLEVHGKCLHNDRSSNCIAQDKFDRGSSSWRQKRGMAALAGLSIHHSSREKCLQVWNSPDKNPRGKNSKMASQADPINKKSNQLEGAEVSDFLTDGASSQDLCSKASSPHAEPERFAHRTWSGPMTISRPERPKSPTSSRSHVHPKLPDYDELEAKFRALKQDYLQRTSAITRG